MSKITRPGSGSQVLNPRFIRFWSLSFPNHGPKTLGWAHWGWALPTSLLSPRTTWSFHNNLVILKISFLATLRNGHRGAISQH